MSTAAVSQTACSGIQQSDAGATVCYDAPTGKPSGQPTHQPTMQPTGQPTQQPSTPTGQPTSKPTGQPSIQPTSMPSSQPSGTPTGYPTRYIRTTIQLTVYQQVQGITTAEFSDEAKADYINGLVTALQDEIPGLRAPMISITGVTTVVARRLNPSLRSSSQYTDKVDKDKKRTEFQKTRDLGASSVSEVAYEIVYIAEELGCSSGCDTGAEADEYFRTLLADSTNHAAISSYLATYSNVAALQGITVYATTFPNAFTLIDYKTQYPTSMPTTIPTSNPTATPDLGPNYTSFFSAYGAILAIFLCFCICGSCFTVFAFSYPDWCTPWCWPCCLTEDSRQRLQLARERKKHLAIAKQQKREAAKAKQALLKAERERYRVVPIAASGEKEAEEQELSLSLEGTSSIFSRTNRSGSGGPGFAAAFKQRANASTPKVSAAQKARVERIRHNAERKVLMNKGLPYELSEKRLSPVTTQPQAQRGDGSSDEEQAAPCL